MHHNDHKPTNRLSRGRTAAVGVLLLLQLICVGSVAATEAASEQTESADDPLVYDQQQLDATVEADGKGLSKAAPSCDTSRTCMGLVTDMVNWFVVQKNHVRVVLGNSTVKQRLAAYGCGETWSLWWHNEDTNRDLMLNQLVIAEKFGDTVQIIFKKDPDADHCDIDYIYREVP